MTLRRTRRRRTAADVGAVANDRVRRRTEPATSALVMPRIEDTADASLAAIRECNRLGIAMAAMIRMIAITINNSIRVNPRLGMEYLAGISISIPRFKPSRLNPADLSKDGHLRCNRIVTGCNELYFRRSGATIRD